MEENNNKRLAGLKRAQARAVRRTEARFAQAEEEERMKAEDAKDIEEAIKVKKAPKVSPVKPKKG